MFTIEQAKQFLNILDGENIPLKCKAFFQLAIFGGFRRGEILGLEWGDRWHESSRLFTAWNGKPMHGATPFVWLEKLCKAHGLPKVNLHSFRHINHMKTSL